VLCLWLRLGYMVRLHLGICTGGGGKCPTFSCPGCTDVLLCCPHGKEIRVSSKIRLLPSGTLDLMVELLDCTYDGPCAMADGQCMIDTLAASIVCYMSH